ncbi:MAG: hypothetical protein SGARI_007973, partial [Bacillariaceae sp.]
MTLLFGIKKKLGGGGSGSSVKDGQQKCRVAEEKGEKPYSSCRQLPVAATGPDPDDAVERSMFRRRLNRSRIPLVIQVGLGSSSSGSSPPSSPMVQKNKKKQSQSPRHECLRLIESDLYEDNRLGIEQLVVIVNRELVNSKTNGSIAEALICPSNNINDDDDFATRIRAVFPTFFTEDFLQKSFRNTKKPVGAAATNNNSKRDSETQESQSTDETSFYSDLSNSTVRRYRKSMKLPALRVFVSSLELMSRKRKKQSLAACDDPFWKQMLFYISDSLHVMHLEPVESSLCVKALRHVYKLDPETLLFHTQTITPLVQAAQEHGRLDGDRML